MLKNQSWILAPRIWRCYICTYGIIILRRFVQSFGLHGIWFHENRRSAGEDGGKNPSHYQSGSGVSNFDMQRSRFEIVLALFILPWSIRTLGVAALTLCYIALGIVEAYYIEGPGISTWDIAAASLIISEAGGVVVDRITGCCYIFSESISMFKLLHR